MINPRDVRSVNAAFDPDFTDSPNLLSQSDFGDLTVTQTGKDDAGNDVTVTEKASVVWDSLQKRLETLDKLTECVNG